MKINVKDFLDKFSAILTTTAKSAINGESVNLIRIRPHTPGILLESKDFMGEMRMYGEVVSMPKAAFCLDGTELYSILKFLSGDATIDFRGKKVEISCGKFGCSIPGFPETDMPEIVRDVPDTLSLSMQGSELAALLRSAFPFCHTESIHAFSGVFFIGNNVYGSDIQRVFKAAISTPAEIPFAIASSLKDRSVKFCDSAGMVNVMCDESTVVLVAENGESVLVCNAHAGLNNGLKMFGTYEISLSSEPVQSEFVCDANQMRLCASRVAAVVPSEIGGSGTRISVMISGDSISMAATGIDSNSNEIIPVKNKKKDPYSFFMQSHMLLSALGPHAGAEITCKIGGRAPLVISSPGIETHVAPMQ